MQYICDIHCKFRSSNKQRKYIYHLYLGNVESIQVSTTVDEDSTIAFSPTGGIKGTADDSSEKSSSFVLTDS